MKYPVLVLNRSYYPVDIISHEDAFIKIYGEKAEVVQFRDEVIYSAKDAHFIPSIIRNNNSRIPKTSKLRCKRTRVFERDRNTCAYCNQTFPVSKLTWDHIVPQCKGGEDTWLNTITACWKCNNKKGDKDLESSGLKLHFLPYEPKNFWDFKMRDQKLIEEWYDYLPV